MARAPAPRPPPPFDRSRRVSDAARLRRRGLELLADLHQPQHLVLSVGATALQVLDLMLDRFELLGVRDAAVVEPLLLCGGLLGERIDLVLEHGLVATDLVELQPKLPQPTLGGVSLVARGGELAPRLEHLLASAQTIDRRVDLLQREQSGHVHRCGSVADGGTVRASAAAVGRSSAGTSADAAGGERIDRATTPADGARPRSARCRPRAHPAPASGQRPVRPPVHLEVPRDQLWVVLLEPGKTARGARRRWSRIGESASAPASIAAVTTSRSFGGRVRDPQQDRGRTSTEHGTPDSFDAATASRRARGFGVPAPFCATPLRTPTVRIENAVLTSPTSPARTRSSEHEGSGFPW